MKVPPPGFLTADKKRSATTHLDVGGVGEVLHDHVGGKYPNAATVEVESHFLGRRDRGAGERGGETAF